RSRPPDRGPRLFPYTTLFRSRDRDRPRTHGRRLRARGGHRWTVGGERDCKDRELAEGILLGQRRARGRGPWAGGRRNGGTAETRSEEHTSELQSREKLVCRLL